MTNSLDLGQLVTVLKSRTDLETAWARVSRADPETAPPESANNQYGWRFWELSRGNTPACSRRT